MEILNNISSEEVVLDFMDNRKAVLIVPNDTDEPNVNYLSLIMPVYI